MSNQKLIKIYQKKYLLIFLCFIIKSRDGQERKNRSAFRNAFLILWNAQERVPEIFFRNGSHCNAFLTPQKWPRSRSFQYRTVPGLERCDPGPGSHEKCDPGPGTVRYWPWNGAILALDHWMVTIILKFPPVGTIRFDSAIWIRFDSAK